MKQLAWMSDIHLDHLHRHPKRLLDFYTMLAELEVDAYIITGDIASSQSVQRHLKAIAEAVQRPVYFVLGNHDFYYSSTKDVRKSIRELCEANEHLIYLPDEGPIAISDECCLVGVDGWGDGGYGDQKNFVGLNDYDLISDYTPPFRITGQDHRTMLLNEMQKHGKIEAAIAAEQLKLALGKCKDIVFATHVPPFIEATWHEGAHSEPKWLCGFSCRAVGDLLRVTMNAHPENQMLVICGHSHGDGKAQVTPNIFAWTGGARYGVPKVETILEYE